MENNTEVIFIKKRDSLIVKCKNSDYEFGYEKDFANIEDWNSKNNIGKSKDNLTIKNGKFKNYLGSYSKNLVIKKGNFKDYTGYLSNKSIIFGGSFEKETFRGASGIKAYIPKAKSVCPFSGYIIAGEVDEINSKLCELDGTPDVTIYTTKIKKIAAENKDTFYQFPNVSEDYKKNIYYIRPDYLKQILLEMNYHSLIKSTNPNNFQTIEEYNFACEGIMDNLIMRVDELSEAISEKVESKIYSQKILESYIDPDKLAVISPKGKLYFQERLEVDKNE